MNTEEKEMYEVGQLIYGIEYDGVDLDNAEVSGYLYMAECNDYVICASNYVHCNGDFERQLGEMYRESIDDYGVKLYMLCKHLTFSNQKEAHAKLDELLN